MKASHVSIRLAEIQPHVLRSALNPLQPGFKTGLRVIEHYQIQYIYQGEGSIEIDGTSYAASKGHLFYWGPGQVHAIQSSTSSPLTILGVQFEMFPSQKNMTYSFIDFKGFPNHLLLYEPAKGEQILLDMAKEYTQLKLFFQERINSLFRSFLFALARQIAASAPKNGGEWQDADHVMAFLQENFRRPLKNQEVADRFGFHPNYLNHLFQTHTGMTLHKYLLHLRLNHATELLLTTDLKIGEIAEAVGFTNIHYFSRLFKQKMGFAPSKIHQR